MYPQRQGRNTANICTSSAGTHSICMHEPHKLFVLVPVEIPTVVCHMVCIHSTVNHLPAVLGNILEALPCLHLIRVLIHSDDGLGECLVSDVVMVQWLGVYELRFSMTRVLVHGWVVKQTLVKNDGYVRCLPMPHQRLNGAPGPCLALGDAACISSLRTNHLDLVGTHQCILCLGGRQCHLEFAHSIPW